MFPSFIQIISTNVWQTLGRQYTLDTSLSTIISPHLFYSVTSCLTITEVTLISNVLGLTVPWCGAMLSACGAGIHWAPLERERTWLSSPSSPNTGLGSAWLTAPPVTPRYFGSVRAELASLQSIILQSRRIFLPFNLIIVTGPVVGCYSYWQGRKRLLLQLTLTSIFNLTLSE